MAASKKTKEPTALEVEAALSTHGRARYTTLCGRPVIGLTVLDEGFTCPVCRWMNDEDWASSYQAKTLDEAVRWAISQLAKET